MNIRNKPILVKGDDALTCSIAVCMLNAGHPVVLFTERTDATTVIHDHLSDQGSFGWKGDGKADLRVVGELSDFSACALAVIITQEDEVIKLSTIQTIQPLLSKDAVIAINSESIPLSVLQEGAESPGRIIGMNWSDPAHTTYFLEIISNEISEKHVASYLASYAKEFWNKDPYVLSCNLSIRSRMTAALVREAFYLLENGYVSIDDVDRACRNDAGYYLAFAGHCRYMDLMGTYVYGKVMEDLNPELSKESMVPEFFNEIVNEGGQGMQNGKGFYTYDSKDAEQRAIEFRKFSYEISALIWRYPFRYKSEGTAIEKVSSKL